MKSKHVILGVHVQNRTKVVQKVQQVLSEYGCNIKTRLGLHEVDERSCSTAGVILLEMFGKDAVCNEMAARLKALNGVQVKKMVFTH
ncbi:MAG: hypothetical protein KA184_19240 [Candidatus Hydrogenedentes bacterium]|nr:hypothetical protein [Candidatus Hydrogenedentota bacterium]